MVKLIDAAKALSIQVHPSDETADTSRGERGKAEMWYIIHAEPRACLYLGFSKRIDVDEFQKRSRDGSICQVLNKVPVKNGDVFFILPGTIHAIGAGITIAEIQQNSNTTFRIYDFQRKDRNGNLRPLHLDRASAVVDFEPIAPKDCKEQNSAEFSEFTMTEMFECTYFRAYKLDIRKIVKLNCGADSFQHLLCVEGDGEIIHHGKRFEIHCGDSYFLPAGMGDYSICGNCRVLLSRG